jgi:hypothetical protein
MLSVAAVFFWPESVHTRELMWGVVWWVQCGDFGVCFLMRIKWKYGMALEILGSSIFRSCDGVLPH